MRAPAPLPRWVQGLAWAALLLVMLPVVGLLARIPWPRLVELVTAPTAVQALRLSLLTCTASLAVVVVLGLPLALVMARSRGPLAGLARLFAVLPMVLPPVVAGLALLVTLGRRGLVGQHLSVLGLEVGFTTLAVVIGQSFVAMPYFVVALEGALRTLDPELERVAATLGASPSHTLRRVTLPVLAPALVGGAAMAMARALGEFGATLTFAGSLPGVTQTLPQAIYLTRESDPDGALALSFVLLVLAVALMGLSGWVMRRPSDG